MRQRNVLITILGVLGVGLAARPAQAQLPFTASDWLMHRGGPTRQGGNGDPGLITQQLVKTWTWPPTAEIPAEIISDNFPLPPPAYVATNRGFTVTGTWVYPNLNDRQFDAWPPITLGAADPNKPQDYVWAEPETDTLLSGYGVDLLSRLPNLGTDAASADAYRQIDQDLNETVNPTLHYARWSFGTTYPYGTFQGTKNVGGNPTAVPPVLPTPIAPNQRYAVFIRFPSSGTLDNGTPRPNTDHVMARVSWGAAINDPKTSRIFMLNFGQTGGFWLRIRNGAGDDRFFPYDGVNPIQVTLYTRTPDDAQLPDQNKSIIVADAVRLVPEAMRGDIHGPAVSAKFPATAVPAVRTIQRTYFGRDETTGPVNITNLADVASGKFGYSGFTAMLFDPSKPPQPNSGLANYNPVISDPSSSARAAVFYCIEDDLANGRYGRLAWRYVARSTPVASTTVDDSAAAPAFTATNVGLPGGWAQTNNPLDQPFGATYYTTPVSIPPATNQVATWQQPLPSTKAGDSYSVFAWIPGGSASGFNFAHYAHYRITTDAGPLDFEFDQRNNMAVGQPSVGGWRRIATGIHFPSGTYNGNPTFALGTVNVFSESVKDVAEDPARVVAADAVQFVSESQSSNSVVASPLLANITFPSGTIKQAVYFATTDGHIWALDALGQTGPGAAPQSTLTTAYWVYPSISNPDPTGDKNANGIFDGPQDDPNFNPDAVSNRPAQGIDADLVTAQIPDPNNPNLKITVYQAVNKTPDLGPFVSSPVLMQVPVTNGMVTTYTPFIVAGNQNGRIYALDPVGRVDGTGNAFPATFANGDNPGVPGTTRRTMTWPTLARDKWLRKGGLTLGANSFATFTDDAAKGYFSASIAVPVIAGDPTYSSDRLIAGAGDGHVYCVDMQKVDPRERISNSAVNTAQDGTPRWQYPDTHNALPAIVYPGALTDAFDRYVFSAGGRVYAIDNPATQSNGTATLQWVYPFTATPPGNPAATDVAPLDTDFTAPLIRSGLGINGGKMVAYVANKTGQVYALDGSQVGGAAPATLWTSFSEGSTRASVTFLSNLNTQFGLASGNGPSLFLPNDGGGIVAFQALTGAMNWAYFDSILGEVPVQDSNGNPVLDSSTPPVPVTVSTSTAWRGADATVANQWVFSGDEGVQDTGEMNGQMRAYGSDLIGGVTPGEPNIGPGAGGVVQLRLVDVWNAHRDDPMNANPTLVWEDFRSLVPAVAKSPYLERWKRHQKPNTQSGVVVYEWGDTIYVAAWGIYTRNNLPSVWFTLSGNGAPITRQGLVQPDIAYTAAEGPPPILVHDPTDPDPNSTVEGHPFIATYEFQLNRGNEENPQTPGTFYQVSAYAQTNNGAGGGSAPSFRLQAGQFDRPYPDAATLAGPVHALRDPSFPDIGNPPPANPDNPNGDWMAPRGLIIAHPFALTTRGIPGGTGVGPAVLNSVGWTNNYPVDLGASDISEIIANGNFLATVSPTAVIPTGLKDLVAPMGMISHGTAGAYFGVDPTGKQVPAFFIADRSNLYKIGTALNNIRLARAEMRWGWNTNDPASYATGNVMNALPWEFFPNTVPNVSPDYPDVDRSKVSVKNNGVDISVRALSLKQPIIAGGIKTLQPVQLDLQVEVPKYQPANVNTNYFDLNRTMNANHPNGLLAPMLVSTGGDPSGTPQRPLIAPSAGYVGTYLLYIDSDNSSKYEGTQALDFNNTPPAILNGREEVFRQIHVGMAVPPDVNIRTEEETVDLGNMPHGMGYNPNFPFRPSYVQGVANVTPWDPIAQPGFYAPFTVKNGGNVNLVAVTMSKIVGDYQTDYRDPRFWVRMTSDQVDPITNPPIWSVPFNLLGGPAVGNLGVVTSIDHPFGPSAPAATQWDNQLYPYNIPGALGNDYVLAGNVLGWVPGTRLRPTIHKPRVETSPQTMSVPDVAFGDPLNELSTLQAFDTANGRPARSVKPKISVAIPLTTPAGTYSATMWPFEDHTPEQWRQWVYFYRNVSAPTFPAPGDYDGTLNMTTGTTFLDSRMMPEGRSDPGFRLKVTVRENRLTNGTIPGSFDQIDVRGNQPAFGGNLLPGAFRENDPTKGRVFLYWTSNRPNNGGPAPATSDAPWYLQYSTLNAVNGSVAPYGPIFDWRYTNNLSRWWDPLTATSAYPDPANLNKVFPSQLSDLGGLPPNTPLIPGVPVPETVRHATPAVVQDDDAAKLNPQPWLFWQGFVTKNASAGATTQRLDTRTFYVPLVNGAPQNPIPYSFLNDPALPKFATKPLIITDQNNNTYYFLFWYGGSEGRTRLFYNVTTDPTNPTSWSNDVALPTPGALQWQANPVPIHRRVYTDFFNGPPPAAPQLVDAIDVAYTGVLANRRQPETLLTRYAITVDGGRVRLVVIPQTRVDNEIVVRDGVNTTWMSRDLAWLYRDPQTKDYLPKDPIDLRKKPLVQVFVYDQTGASYATYPGGAPAPINGYDPNTGTFNGPTFDNATGRLYFSSVLGGQVVLDPQNGTVTFVGIAPRNTDKVVLRYIPQSLRANVTRNDSGVVTPPAGWTTDAGFTGRPHVAATGSNTEPVAFIDRSPNARRENIFPALAPGAVAPPVNRMWLFYKKTNANSTSTASIYYKTMRLMVRLPRGVIRDYDTKTGQYSLGKHITVNNNRGPYEVDWVRGRVYFTDADEGNMVDITFDYTRDNAGNPVSFPLTSFRVGWGDEISTAVNPGDQTTNEAALPTDTAVNEGMVSAFKDPFQDKVWVFWSSTRSGTSDLFYMTISPQFYTQPAQ
jgi:hypothetical protein